jgi:uncharacterized LabA/DUF88 family protein
MKTFIQIDVQNLFFSARDINKRIDFKRIRDHFHESGEEITGLKAYIIRTPDAKSDKFEALLKSLNYDMIIKNAAISRGADGQRIYKNTDQDMAICIDCLTNINNFDKWVLMSGDGDFIDLCKHLKKLDKFIEVWSLPGVSFNRNFCDYADQIVFMNDKFFFDKDDIRQDGQL